MSKIAIDMRALDGASQFRGIGIYIQRLSGRLLPLLLQEAEVFLYVYDTSNLKDIDQALVKKCTVITANRSVFSRAPDNLKKYYNGILPRTHLSASKLPEVESMDHFFQPYHEFGVPKSTPSTLVCHDLIPLLFEKEYFHRIKASLSPKSWVAYLREAGQRNHYKAGLKTYHKATKILAVSSHTKQTLIDNLAVPEKKISVVLHGNESTTKPGLTPRLDNHIQRPYVVYVGGIDYRRDVVGLLDAAPSLYEAHGIRTVVAGKDFEATTDSTITQKLADYTAEGSVISLGFISEDEKQTLLHNAISFVYPTLYEGFGLPVLEAFNAKVPIVTFRNSSLPEIGGDAVIFVESIEEMMQAAVSLQKNTTKRSAVIRKGTKQAAKFTWEKTAKETASLIFAE